ARPGETRDGMPMDDLYSASVSVELPLFPTDRQDRRLAAAREEREAARAERDAALRRLRAELDRELALSAQLEERLRRYESQLLPLAREALIGAEAAHASAAAEPEAVFRARDSGLLLRQEALRLRADRLASLARIAWLLDSDAAEMKP
ncbi:MAG: TolC family protein, partial [Gammaproteobacteria bacterium]